MKAIKEHSPSKSLRDSQKILRHVHEFLAEGDHLSAMELLGGLLIRLNKSRAAKELGITRQSLYNYIRGKRIPNIKVFSRMMKLAGELSNKPELAAA
ncbi:MAG: helix-turn-helix domain-containing protein [Elusimicrobiota bacterium]